MNVAINYCIHFFLKYCHMMVHWSGRDLVSPVFQSFATTIIFRLAGTVPHFPHRAPFIEETCALDRTLSTTHKVNCYSLYYGF